MITRQSTKKVRPLTITRSLTIVFYFADNAKLIGCRFDPFFQNKDVQDGFNCGHNQDA